jgi:DNA-binding NarL/FixJ family response regulator
MPDGPSSPRPIRVAVVAADRRVRSALASLLAASDAVTLGGSSGSVREALIVARAQAPDVVVVDDRFSDSDPDGRDALALLRVAAPEARILMLRWPEAGDRMALDLGVDGVLDATSLLPSALLEAIVSGPVAPGPTAPQPGV